MQFAADRLEAPTAIRTDLGAIFISLELSRSSWVVTSLSPGGGEKMSKHTVRDRRAREGKPDTRWRTQCEANPQTRSGEECRRLVEHLAESLGGARAMRRAERSQGDVQLAIADADVAGSGKQLMQQGSPFLIGTGVVRSQQRPPR